MREVISVMLAGGAGLPHIRVVADVMGTSVRVLQRQLQMSGATYADVAQQTRCAAAEWMLKDGRLRIGDVARALGYRDPAHFTRAFQRWTGLSPRAFRRRA